MRSQITGLRVASVVFGLMALAQLMRLITHPAMIVGGSALPLWPSFLGFIVMGGLSFWMWTLTQRVSR
jgi:hypothetical protein